MPKNVQVPGLGLVQFPDGMSNEAVSAAIRGTFAQKSGGAPPPVPKAPIPAALQGPPVAPSTLSNVGDAVVNYGKGIVKGGMSTFLNLAQKGNEVRDWGSRGVGLAQIGGGVRR